jgi:ABC-type Mn2+/Zn2+ transport system permease subunit
VPVPLAQSSLVERLALYDYPLIAGLAVVLMCSALSTLVVVKRLGFVGQGISHSAFGGVGVAALLAALGLIPRAGLAEAGVVLSFCIFAALGMAGSSDRRAAPVDTVIGVFLVASMALGGLLTRLASSIASSRGTDGADTRTWESILFGSILTCGPADAQLAWGSAGAVVVAAWWFRRPLAFWAFDEDSARAFGVPTGRAKALTLILLAVAVVTAMRLAGVVLATALLVLPGAAALRISDRSASSLGWSCAIGVTGLLLGLFASAAADLEPGPSVVLALTLLLALAAGLDRLRRAAAAGGANNPA